MMRNYALAPEHNQATYAIEKPKVLFLSPVGFFKGGAERSLQDLLANPQITPFVMAPEDGPILERARAQSIPNQILDFGSINTIKRPFSFRKGLGALNSLYKAATELKRFCKSHEIKVVHSNGLKAHMINVISRRLGGPAAIIHIRDIPYTRPEKLVWQIMHILCDRMILVSAPCWPGKTLPKKALVIHNGIDITKIPKPRPIVISSNGMTIGFAGRIHPAKGLHLLLDWFAAAIQKGHKIKLSIRGSFSDEAPEYKSMISKQIDNLKIGEYIEFTGHISNPESVYQGLDIVVVPSEIPDPLPRSVMEAMAQGLIVFGYPAGGITDMIDDGDSGYLVSDQTSFCRALEQVTLDTKKRQFISMNAREKILSKFTIENLFFSVFNVYRDSMRLYK